MTDVSNELVDRVLLSVQSHLADLESNVADIRSQLAAVQQELESLRRSQPEVAPPPASLEGRIDRLERRLDASDIAHE